MFGIPLVTWVIIACIAALALSMVPSSVWASLKPKAVDSAGLPTPVRPVAEAPAKYLAVQKVLLEARTACGECPEAITAIDAAIKATVAMVVKPNAFTVGIRNDWAPFPPEVKYENSASADYAEKLKALADAARGIAPEVKQ